MTANSDDDKQAGAPVAQSARDDSFESRIRGAIGRGWCDPRNSGKVIDIDLANAIAEQVLDALAAPVAPGERQEYRPNRLVSISVDGSTHTRTAAEWLDISRKACGIVGFTAPPSPEADGPKEPPCILRRGCEAPEMCEELGHCTGNIKGRPVTDYIQPRKELAAQPQQAKEPNVAAKSEPVDVGTSSAVDGQGSFNKGSVPRSGQDV